ncbi:MAG: DUF1559 domain-containing protein [Planctomycetales bacterium]|nr:DUF1559 domain-containing protein [Planctomycetales bacterium]
MPIEFVCPHCGEKSMVDERYAGTSGPCRNCRKTVTIPQLSTTRVASTPKDKSGVWAGLAVGCVVGLVFLFLVGGILVALLLPAVQAAREAARRNTCLNNTKQIALAMLNYETANGHLPPAYTVDEDGNPLHSWRVLILPYLGESGLYNQIDLTKPWDDPANAVLQNYVPPVYACPSHASSVSGSTDYVVITGPETAFPGSDTVRVRDISDGMSRTLMIVELSGQTAHWSAPQDITLDQFVGGSGQSSHPGGYNASFMDGHCQFFTSGMSPAELRAMATRAGND